MSRRFGFILLGVGFLALAACGGGGGQEDVRIPTLIGSSPADGATGVAHDSVVDLFWEQALDPTTVTTGHIELQAPSGSVPGTLSYDDGARRIRFVADERLALGTRHTARVSPGLATADGRVLEAPYEVSFRIRAGGPISSQLLETEAVDSAAFNALALTAEGRGFAIWSQSPDTGDRTLHATALDLANGRGPDTVLGSAEFASTTEAGVAINPAGYAIVSWATQDTTDDVWASIYRDDLGTWSLPVKLNLTPGETARDPRVGIDANGNALVVWTQQAGFGLPEDLWYRQWQRSGGWTGAQRLESVGGAARGTFVAMHATGRACVVWHQQYPTVFNIYARRYDPATGWSAVELVESDDVTRALAPQVAIAPSGDILVCWYQEEGAAHTDTRMWANRYVPGSGWDGAVMLRDDEGENRGFELAMDEAGTALVVWRQYVNPQHYVHSRRLPAGGAWQDTGTVSGTNSYNVHATPDLALDAAGGALVIWGQSSQTGALNLLARAYVPGAGWGEIATVRAIDGDTSPIPRLACDPEGNAIAVWHESVYDTDGTYLRTDAWSNTYRAGAGWHGATLLEDVDVSSAYARAVRMDRHGRGVAIWTQVRAGGSDSDVYYTIFR